MEYASVYSDLRDSFLSNRQRRAEDLEKRTYHAPKSSFDRWGPLLAGAQSTCMRRLARDHALLFQYWACVEPPVCVPGLIFSLLLRFLRCQSMILCASST